MKICRRLKWIVPTIPGAVFDLPTAYKSDPITVKDRLKFGRRSPMSLNRHQFHQGGPAQL